MCRCDSDLFIGMPTDKLLRIVESNETRTHFVASSRLVFRLMTRSRIGLPYLASPVLEKRRVGASLDEVSFGIGPEQTW